MKTFCLLPCLQEKIILFIDLYVFLSSFKLYLSKTNKDRCHPEMVIINKI